MKFIWSYLIVALCRGMTSASIMDFPGNRHGFYGNLDYGIKYEKVQTPPTDSSLFIDSNGYPGNSNEPRIEDIKTEDLPLHFKRVLKALFNQNENSQYEIIPFNKEDIINMENSELCKTMCEHGVKKPPCMCE